MTFWGFLFMVLIVFVAFYAWYRFARRGVNAPRLGGDRHTDIRRANQPMMAETGTIGERSKFKSARPKRHRSAEVQKYLTEVGTIGDAPQAQRRPIAGYLPAPKQDFSTEVGAIGDVQASSTSSAMNQTNTPQQQAIASENVGSTLSQAQLNPNHDQSEWLENSDLERLNNQAQQDQHQQKSGDELFDGMFDHVVNSVGTFMEEVGEDLGHEFEGLGHSNNNSRNRLHAESLNPTTQQNEVQYYAQGAQQGQGAAQQGQVTAQQAQGYAQQAQGSAQQGQGYAQQAQGTAQQQGQGTTQQAQSSQMQQEHAYNAGNGSAQQSQQKRSLQPNNDSSPQGSTYTQLVNLLHSNDSQSQAQSSQQENDRVELMQQLQDNNELVKSAQAARGDGNATSMDASSQGATASSIGATSASMQTTDPLTQSNQQSAAYESTAAGAPSGQSQSYMQPTQDFSTEAGLIGDVAASATYPDQARLGTARSGYVHQQDMEIGMLDNDTMLANFPDQLPTLNPRSFKDPDCK